MEPRVHEHHELIRCQVECMVAGWNYPVGQDTSRLRYTPGDVVVLTTSLYPWADKGVITSTIQDGWVHLKVKWNKSQMYVVHWRLGNATGHGQPMTKESATAWADLGNKQYGAGTHRVVPA